MTRCGIVPLEPVSFLLPSVTPIPLTIKMIKKGRQTQRTEALSFKGCARSKAEAEPVVQMPGQPLHRPGRAQQCENQEPFVFIVASPVLLGQVEPWSECLFVCLFVALAFSSLSEVCMAFTPNSATKTIIMVWQGHT